MKNITDINWKDGRDMISENFSVFEALYLPGWKRMATEADGLDDQKKTNLVQLCEKLELIRAFLEKPLNVHSMYRPPQYSVSVGGFANDVHTLGQACDFNPYSMTCAEAKTLLLPKLVEFGIRMENNGDDKPWVHADIHPVIHQRYFKP